ncbi:MAG: hypothetical protein M1837_002868 [Sclerophora amabilis]|nr:MAG: hypothetical protein M1837_002868 [Sclerophora amabilis]
MADPQTLEARLRLTGQKDCACHDSSNVPPDGLRDGSLGDDEPLVRSEEGLQIDILSCIATLSQYMPLFRKLTPHLRNVSPHQSEPSMLLDVPVNAPFPETKNTWHRPDPSFTYLLSFFMLLTAFAWGISSTTSFTSMLRLTLIFIFVHFLALSLLIATVSYFLVGRLLAPGVAGLPGRRRQGLFGQTGDGDQLEFGYCFDVAIRSFFPVWVFLYVVQFIMIPLVIRDYWISLFLGNALYLVALSYYTIITFLGYNGTHLLEGFSFTTPATRASAPHSN